MRKIDYKVSFVLLSLALFILNMLQAKYTGVISDETYYSLYGKHLSWGYFDHPPMVALMVKISSMLFSGALGIRFITVIAHIITIFFTWKAIDDQEPDTPKVLTFFLLATSTALFSILGVITTPDSALLLFISLFLYAYRQFLKNATWLNTVFMAVAMAGLVYSKYQAALVILFVLLSNIRLLMNRKFLVSGFLAVVLFFPHLYWQYAHDFPTFRYHLVERAGDFEWKYVYEYFPNLLAAYNPFIFGAIVYLIVRNNPRDHFERALQYLIVGFVVFFWTAATRGHVQPQWTLGAAIPMIILLYKYLWQNEKLRRFIYLTAIPTLVLMVVIRIMLTGNNVLSDLASVEKHRAKTEAIEKAAGNLPVLFFGSFQESSKYEYFVHKPSFTLGFVDSRHTQFDIWQIERQYHNKPVFICQYVPGMSKWYRYDKGWICGFATDSLQTVNRMELSFHMPDLVIERGEIVKIHCTIHNPYNFDINFNHPRFPVQVVSVFFQKENPWYHPVKISGPVGIIKAGETISREITLEVPQLLDGTYHFGFSLSTSICKPQNSKLVEVRLK